jgi:hypothetical protein
MKTSFILASLIIHIYTPQAKPVFSPILTGRYDCRTGSFEVVLPNKIQRFQNLKEADEFVTDQVGSFFPFEVLEQSVIDSCSGKPIEIKSIPSRSITLLTRDNQPIAVNGKPASSGARLRKAAKIETPPNVGATITGLHTRIDVSPNTSFSVEVDSQTRVTINLHYGCIDVKTLRASQRQILVEGKVYKVSQPMCRNDSEAPVEMELPPGHAGAGSGMGVKPSKGLPTPPQFVYPIRWGREKDLITFELGDRIETRGRRRIIQVAKQQGCKRISDSECLFPDGSSIKIIP